MLPRRRLLQSALAGFAWRTASRPVAAQPAFGDADRPRVLALAGVVLPSSLDVEGRQRAVDQFLRWVRDYRPGAESDHGYGVTGIRTLPASPAQWYSAHLDDLDRRAGGRLAAVSADDQRRIVADAIDASGVRDLPARPTGGHIATDLMSHYFRSPSANDLAYGRAIGRDACRDLRGSEDRPTPLPTSGVR